MQNNILERLHASLMPEWGAAGNVFAYNLGFGNYDSTGCTSPATVGGGMPLNGCNDPYVTMGGVVMHGAHPQFNLFEGNVMPAIGADSIWGSNSDNTYFRNWAVGTNDICYPVMAGSTLRSYTVSCAGSNGVWSWQAGRAVNLTFLNDNFNFIGDVIGTTQTIKETYDISGSGILSKVQRVMAICGTSPCGTSSRQYENTQYDYSLGFGEASDSGGTGANGQGCGGPTTYPCESLTPYNTLFLHGEYSNAGSTTIWASGVTQTLPASFYLSAVPAWWEGAHWPAIGPDVTGGSGPGGHAYSIPAQNCYTNVMGGTDGSGSPLTFNAATCYPPPPVPATGLSATPH